MFLVLFPKFFFLKMSFITASMLVLFSSFFVFFNFQPQKKNIYALQKWFLVDRNQCMWLRFTKPRLAAFTVLMSESLVLSAVVQWCATGLGPIGGATESQRLRPAAPGRCCRSSASGPNRWPPGRSSHPGTPSWSSQEHLRPAGHTHTHTLSNTKHDRSRHVICAQGLNRHMQNVRREPVSTSMFRQTLTCKCHFVKYIKYWCKQPEMWLNMVNHNMVI